jgi:histidine ammonia-lyase
MLQLTGEGLTLKKFIDVVRNEEQVSLADSVKKKVKKSREIVDNLVKQNKVVYGLTTGFGPLCNVSIPQDKTEELQRNLIRSHASGVGEPYSEEIVRGAMLLRASALAIGHSGVRIELVEKLLELLNKKVYPYVPEKGSVGASGDLAPLSHLGLVVMGEGECLVNGKRVSSKEVLQNKKIIPLALSYKEGLAFNNGTPFITSVSALTIYDSEMLVKNAQIANAMTLDSQRGCSAALDPRLYELRSHPGAKECANVLLNLLEGSKLMNSNKNKVQDAYSLRASATVLGASMDAINYVKRVVETEMNSVTDNPLVFEDGAVSGANFHGQPMALAMDFLAIALSEIADISERRVAKLVDSKNNEDLPGFLIEGSGLNSGFMIPPYTAAALVSENKVLSHPASVDSIPTSANQEDHVSMGSISARKAMMILKNVQNVIAIELLCSAQALDFRKEKPSTSVSKAHKFIRRQVSFAKEDRAFYKDIEVLLKMVESGELVKEIFN